MDQTFRKRGKLFTLSGPAGAGKTTIRREAAPRLPSLRESISYTTRQPRPGEQNGVDYYFVSEAEFERIAEEDAFLEWALVHGRHYGTHRDEVLRRLEEGFDVLLEIDTQGAEQIRRRFPGTIFIFVWPPSLIDLERRLRGRGTEPEEVVQRRLTRAKEEMRAVPGFDYLIINDNLADAVRRLESIFIAESCRTGDLLPGLDIP